MTPARQALVGQTFDLLRVRQVPGGRFQDPNVVLTWENVELSGLEPLTSCMPSSGNPSTRVYSRRSPSSHVHSGPPASGPVAVLSCCTAAVPANRTSHAPSRRVTSQNLPRGYR